MAKLLITLDGGPLTETALDESREYILGRGSQCDIILPHAKVSRQHAKVFFDGQAWNCKVISKFGRIEVNRHAIDEIILNEGTQLVIAPFEIKFSKATVEEERPENAPQSATDSFADHTRVASVALKAVLRRIDSQGEIKKEYTIEDHTTIAGRSSSCQIPLEDAHASRRHFTITYDGELYLLKDLKSSNKTYVNGEEIKEHVLESGDEISVGAERLRFELIHPDFVHLPAVITPAPLAHPAQALGQSPAVIKYVPQHQVKAFLGQLNSSKNARFKSVLLFSVLGIIVYGALSGNSKNQAPVRSVASGSAALGANNAFDRLAPEQKKFIEETYNLALNLYTTGKYDLAAIEVGKVLTVVNNYKDAKNILALCQQAQEIKKQQDEADRVQRDQDGVKLKVTTILETCDTLFKQKKFAQVEGCVNQIAELDPDNERAMNLVSSAKAAIDEIDNAKEERAAHAHQKAKAAKTFLQAQKDFKAKRYPAALQEFLLVEKVAMVDSDNLKEKAKSGALSVKEQMLKESQALVAEGKSSFDAKEYGEAVNKFSKALELAPFNSEARDLREKAKNERHQELKNVYSESVIEENLGNIESAKKKWANILKEGDKSDSYFEKAQIKLRKYEK